jgi:hypothetical protein
MLISVAVPTANPLAFDAAGITGGIPITIKSGASRTQQNKANRKNPYA